ncbi:hypothetical protein SCP_0304860 [Sparassis crispa]|uniref:Serine hydrolase domain-containing protein n=1 Tax=Sparassis crispa TaxID=139825 RepID=A0A401GF09_9APHY|nr:hypothetical protein SCP_0304860 [Sparassis crispa]GBE80767.1 hypothetical protein SCP_0304860 [Sparassis crispa]
MTTNAPRRVLMLHGYAQSATIFGKRMGAVRKTCGKDIDFVFIDGPLVLSPVDIAKAFSTSVEESGASEASTQDPALAPRGWWRAEPGSRQTFGLEDSLTLLRDVLQKDHYDGVFGFSQGAAMAALLAALLERPDVYPPFLVNGQAPHPPFQYCVSVAGFRPTGPLCDSIFQSSYATPTLHILGKTDIVVTEERSKHLLELSTNKRVEYHDGGHFVPSKANWRNFLRSYLRGPLGDVPSPSPMSQPASGVATPLSEGLPATHEVS